MLKLWQRAVLLSLGKSLFLAGVFFVLSIPAALAEVAAIPGVHDLQHLARTVKEWLSQGGSRNNQPAEVVQVTAVKANPTDKGVEVILQTPQGEQLQVVNRSTGNSYIADIPNAQLRLPKGDAFVFRSEKPITGITEITVINFDANTIRVTVTGEAGVPTVELFDSSEEGLIFGVVSPADSTTPQQQPETQPTLPRVVPGSETQPDKPSAEGEEEIEVVVTGEQEEGYSVPNASTATRTDTPIRDIPQSIQVVPQQVLEDRNVRNLTEAVETVSGIVDAGRYNFTPAGSFNIRGFGQGGNFRNGFRDVTSFALTGVGTIEQVEVLKGPASVLFGAVEPGGIVNVVTRQPLSEPYYNLAFEAGNRGFYQPSIDLSGPLTTDETLLYRFIASYQSSDGFQDFVNTNLTTIAPSITLNLGDRTALNLYYEYINFNGYPPESFSGFFSDGSLLPRSLYVAYPQSASSDLTTQKLGYTLSHEFNDNWQIRNNLSVFFNRATETNNFPLSLVDDSFFEMGGEAREFSEDNYFGQIDLLGKFNTGAISHQLLLGFDFNRYVVDFQRADFSLPNLDISNLNYNLPESVLDAPDPLLNPVLSNNSSTQAYGVYLQDQISLLDNLKLLIGGRFNWVSDKNTFNTTGDTQRQNDSAFSPRIGLVYQPSNSVSLYTSYSQSFLPSRAFSRNPDDEGFKPTRGTQYEAGIKADFLDGRLSTTLAAYQITKTNITTPDPDPVLAAQGFSIQIGEQRSRGIELDIAGEILSGWNVIASYAYTNAEVTEDNSTPVGNQFANVPENQASLWTTYEIQKGSLKGLGAGLGLFYIGERQGDLANSFTVRDYLRTDAAIYYRRSQLNVAINIRNLFDINYFTQAYGGTIYLQRGEPFTVIGSISWEF